MQEKSITQEHQSVDDAEHASRASTSQTVGGSGAASTVQEPPLWTWQRRALYQLMSDISEECYCAGWMSGNEYTLWEMVANDKASRSYGQGEVSAQNIADMKAIADQIGGWIRWVDDEEQKDLPIAEWGARFTPMAEWLPMHTRRMAEWEELRKKYDTPEWKAEREQFKKFLLGE